MTDHLPRSAQKTFADEEADEAAQAEFKPLSAEEAQQWRLRNPMVSPWRIVVWQLMAGASLALLTWLVSGRSEWALSILYGAMAVVVPASVMARALSRRTGAARAALISFFVWELVKIVLTVALLMIAPKLLPHLSWLALLAGFVVAMKVYWFAAWRQAKHRKR
jgi:ATP synthase protein I